MAKFLKHVGKDHLGSKVVIVFRELPDDPNFCLCVESQTLPDMYHDNLMRILESGPSQETVDLYKVLERSRFGDGQPMLQALHQKGLLKKYPVDQIQVEPMPNRAAQLRDVNNQIREGKGESVLEAAPPEELQSSSSGDDSVVVDTGGHGSAAPSNPQQGQSQQPEVGSEEQKKSAAETKLLQARLMEDDAQNLRKEAYELDPDLKKGGRPKSNKSNKKSSKTEGEADETPNSKSESDSNGEEVSTTSEEATSS